MAAGHFESGADVSSTFLGFVVGVGAWPQQFGVVEMHPVSSADCNAAPRQARACAGWPAAVKATARTMVSIGDQADFDPSYAAGLSPRNAQAHAVETIDGQ